MREKVVGDLLFICRRDKSIRGEFAAKDGAIVEEEGEEEDVVVVVVDVVKTENCR